MNPLGRHWQTETLGLIQTDTNRLPQTDIGERNGGNQFRKTPIEPIRQTLVKRNIGFDPDRHQQVPPDRHWQKRNGGNQFR